MFKNLRYKSCNQSVHILRGHITFRFWIPKVRHVDATSNNNLPCRFKIRLDGFEWFIYNRAEAYEFLRSMLESTSPSDSSSAPRHSNAMNGSRDSFASLDFKTGEGVDVQASTGGLLTRFLPIEFVGRKGSIVIGNQDIPTLVILHYKDFTGEYTIGKAALESDKSSSHFKASLSSAKLLMTRNVDYREPLLNQAARLRAQRMDAHESYTDSPFEWLGLARYNVGNDPLQRKLATEEYAKAENFLESESLKILYFCDDAGAQSHDSESMLPPKWGLEMRVKNGSMNYGPWSNRQSSTKTERPKVGQRRIYDIFELALIFEGSTTIRIPFREPSKDWKYVFTLNEDDAQLKTLSGSRQAGWFDLKTNSLAEIRFAIPITANENGFKTTLTMSLSDVSMLSSLDFSTFLRAQKVMVNGSMESPLIWNAERAWDFRLNLRRSKIFILRDHLTLLQDLIADFTSGPPLDPLQFTPIKYGISGVLNESEISLCTNYNNVIYQPNDLDENIRVEELGFDVDLPFLSFQPPGYEIPFNLKASNCEVFLNFPRSSTLGAFTKDKDRQIGLVEKARLAGRYRFNSKYQPGALDQITCDLEASEGSFQLPGIFIRSVICIASNFFGDFSNYMNIEEYRTRMADPQRHANNQKRKEAANGPFNSLEFTLTANVQNAVCIVPENLYGFQQGTVIRLSSAALTSRSTEFFYEILVTGGPAVCSNIQDFNGNFANLLLNRIESLDSELYIDSVTFSGTRLFGPKPRFLCYAADWRLEVAPIIGHATVGFLSGLQRAMESFIFGMSDRDNALFWEPFLPEIDTFHVVVHMIEITVSDSTLSDVTFMLSTPNGLSFQYDAYVREFWTSRSIVFVPKLILCGFVSLPSDEMYSDASDTSVEVFNLECKVSLSFFGNDKNREEMRVKQLKFIIDQDRETNRCAFLYEDQRELLQLLGREDDSLKWADCLAEAAPIFDPPFSLLFADIALRSGVESNISERFQRVGKNTVLERRRMSETIRLSEDRVDPKPAPSYYNLLRKFKTETYEISDFVTALGRKFTFPKYRCLESITSENFGGKSVTSSLLDSFSLETSNFSLSGSTICFEAIGPISVLATPDALYVLDSLLHPVLSMNVSANIFEEVLDKLYLSYFAKLDSDASAVCSDFNAALLIPQVDVRLIQDSSNALEGTFGTTSVNKPMSTALELRLDGIIFRYSASEEQISLPSTSSSVSPSQSYQTSLSLDVSSLLFSVKCLAGYHDFVVEKLPPSHLHFSESVELSSVPVVGRIYLQGLNFVSSTAVSKSQADNKAFISFDVDLCDVMVTNQTVEVMIFSIFSWMSKIISLQESIQCKSEHQDLMKKKTVFYVLDFTRKNILSTDLPFLSSPSSIWGLGYKREYQNDASWKLLSYLRHYIRMIDKTSVGAKATDIVDMHPSFEDASQAVERWRAREHRELANAKLLSDLFRVPHRPSDTIKTPGQYLLPATMKLMVALKHLKFIIYDSESNRNFIEIEESIFEIGSHPREQTPTNVVVRQASRTRSKSKSEPKATRQSLDFGRATPSGSIEHYTDITARVSISNIVVATDPNFLRFSREIILLSKKIPAALVTPGSPASLEAKPSSISVALNASISINNVSISAAAHNLYMTSLIRNGFCSIIYFSEDLRETPKVWSGINSYLQAKNKQLTLSTILSVDSVSTNVIDIRRPQDTGGLLGLTLESIMGSFSAARDPVTKGILPGWNMGVFGCIGSLGVKLPTSLIKLHAFFEKWGDVDSSISMLNLLFKELGYDDAATSSKPSRASPFSRMNFHFLLNRFSIESDLLSAFKAVYSIDKAVVVVDRNESSRKRMAYGSPPRNEIRTIFMGSIGSHSVNFSPGKLRESSSPDSFLATSTFNLPNLSCKGRLLQCPDTLERSEDQSKPRADLEQLKASFRMGSGEISLNANVLDQLRTAQSLLGGELNDIIEIAVFYSRQRQYSRKSTTQQSDAVTPVEAATRHLFYNVRITMEGLRISLESPLSYLEFQSKFLQGFVMNYPKELESRHDFLIEKAPSSTTLLWKFLVKGLSLSLLQSFRVSNRNGASLETNRQIPLAFVIMDFFVQNYRNDGVTMEDSDAGDLNTLFLLFQKINAVMHPSAMGKLVDSFLYYKKELDRSSFRTAELNQIRNQIRDNTQRLLTTVDIVVPTPKPSKSYFDKLKVAIEIHNFGTAIPLSDNDESIIGSLSSLHSNPALKVVEPIGAPAFMFSVRHIVFSSSRFEKSSAHLRDLCIQFVSSFDQTQESGFLPAAYPVQNRLLLENIHAEVNQSSFDRESTVTIKASIRGFDLDMESTIADYINSLSEIIHKGRERVISALPSTYTAPAASPFSAHDISSEETAVALKFDGTFEFHAGKCKLNGPRTRSPSPSVTPLAGQRQGVSSSPRQIRITKLHSRQQSGASSVEVDVPPEEYRDQILYLPGITLWVDGKTMIGETQNEVPGECERNICLEVLVHPSDNTIHPSILVFFSELMSKLKVRPLSGPALSTPADYSAGGIRAALPKSHSLTVFVRLSETKICLSCQPISKVALTFAMDEADILLSYVPPSETTENPHRQIWSIAVGIRRTAGYLRHAFSPEDCFRGEIPSLGASVVLVGEPERRRYAVEIDLPSLEGSLNVRYLQDFFLFRRLWLNLSYTSGPATGQSSSALPMASDPTPYVAMLRLPTTVLNPTGINTAAGSFLDTVHCVFRLGKVDVSTDLGQAVGKAVVQVQALHLVADASWDQDDFFKKVAKAKVESISIKSEGRLSGVSCVKGIQAVATILRPPAPVEGTEGIRKVGKATLMRASIERIESQIQYQYERILILEIFPARFEIQDDWFSPLGTSLGIHISFNVSVEHVKAILSRRTLPILIQTKQKLLALIEEKQKADMVVASPSASPAMEYDGFDFGLPSAGATSSLRSPLTGAPRMSTASTAFPTQTFVDAQSITPSTSFQNSSIQPKRESDALSSFGSLHTALPGSTSFLGAIPGADSGSIVSDRLPSVYSTLQRISGRLRLRVGNVFVTFTRYNFRDPDCAQLVSKQVVITLDRENLPALMAVQQEQGGIWVQTPLALGKDGGFPTSVTPWTALEGDDVDSNQMVVAAEMTVGEFGGFSVKKGSAKTISQAEERMWSGTDWFTFMNAAASKNVVGFPSTVVVMRTEIGYGPNGGRGQGSAVPLARGVVGMAGDAGLMARDSSPPHGTSTSSPAATASVPFLTVSPARSDSPPASATLADAPLFRTSTDDLLAVPSLAASTVSHSMPPPRTVQVDFSFKSEFAGQIDIALNLGLYRYLQELHVLYVKAILGASMGGGGGVGGEGGDGDDEAATTLGLEGGGGGHSNEAVTQTTSAGMTSGGESVSSLSGTQAGGTNVASSTTTTPGKASSTLTFHRKGEVKFDPQLKVTGDATPWELVQWLGVNKERVPELVFANVTQPLACLLSDAQRLVLRTRVGDVSGLILMVPREAAGAMGKFVGGGFSGGGLEGTPGTGAHGTGGSGPAGSGGGSGNKAGTVPSSRT
ncbi:hypothetical protein HDU67_001749 [Dinochytrium kinnereticum]|nr:hypothetical protein HDU67_001749 [Dinochytrium kinnereticum]